MDDLYSCYQSYMRLYPENPEILTLGRWVWCPPGAIDLPFETAFCSSKYDPYDWHVDPVVGEVRGFVGHSSGLITPRFTGRTFCGAAVLFEQGSPLALMGTPAVDQQGVPLCCDAPPAVGGLAMGGVGSWSDWTSVALWLRSEELIGHSEGQTVPSWPPAPFTQLVGTVTSPTPATYHVDSLSGKGGLLFSARIPTTFDQTILGFGPLPVQDWTVLVVGKTLIGDTHGPVVDDGLASDVPVIVADGLVYATYGGAVVVEDPTAAPALGELHVWGSTRAADQWALWKDGGELVSGAGPTNPFQLERLYANFGAPPAGKCWIPEIMIFPVALPAAEISAISAGLLQKYGDQDMPPTGAEISMATAAPVPGYLFEDGSEYAIADYPELAAYLGGAYDTYRGKAAPASGYFRVPDRRGLALVCGGAASSNPTTSAYAIGQTAGAEDHTNTIGELAAHDHFVTDFGHDHQNVDGPSFGFLLTNGTEFDYAAGGDLRGYTQDDTVVNTAINATGITVASEGGGAAWDIRQPTGVVFRFIKT